MMKQVGLTGGIGSGKTTVGNMFAELGVPVYNSDLEAKKLMADDPDVRAGLLELFGEEAFLAGVLNRSYIAGEVFGNPKRLKALNALVHPAVRHHFKQWAASQKAPYVIQEAAILFENGSYPDFDFMILVTAPKAQRVKRLEQRDNSTEEEILARMEHQWEDAKKIPLAHFVIENMDLEQTRNRVKEVHQHILSAT